MHAKSESGGHGLRIPVKGKVLCVTHASGASLDREVYEEAMRQLTGAFELQGLGRPDRSTLIYRSEWGPPHNSTSLKSSPLGSSSTAPPAILRGRGAGLAR